MKKRTRKRLFDKKYREASWLRSVMKNVAILKRSLNYKELRFGGRWHGEPRRMSFRAFWRKHPYQPGVPRKERRASAKALWKALNKHRKTPREEMPDGTTC